MPEKIDFKSRLMKFQSLIALAIMCVTMAFLSDRFMTADNLWVIMRHISVNVCISVGMTLVIIAGGIDLSVGSIIAITGAIAAGLIKSGTYVPVIDAYLSYTVFGGCIAAIFTGSMLGMFNGIAITKFKVPPFIATLAMLTIARGLCLLWTNGFPITGLGDTFSFIGTGWFFGIPMPVWISAIIVAIAIFITKRTRFGRYVYAVGGNENASRLSGLDVNRIKVIVYTISGALSAVGGLLITSKLNSAAPTAGTGYELDSIAAVVIGGTSLDGGKGSVFGTVQGALIIGVLNNGLVLLGVSPFWKQVIKGCVILTAVIIDKWNSKD